MRVYIYLAIITIIYLPAVLYAQAPGRRDLHWLADSISEIFSLATGLMLTTAFTVYILGIVKNFKDLSTGEADVMKKYYLWGLIAIFVGVSVWALVRMIQDTLLPGSSMSENNQIDLVPKCAYQGNC